MRYEKDNKEFLHKKPDLTEDILENAIKNKWYKYTNNQKLHPTETTYLLFDDLYRVIKESPIKMEITLSILIRMNQNEGNEEMVEYLNNKKKEYNLESIINVESSSWL